MTVADRQRTRFLFALLRIFIVVELNRLQREKERDQRRDSLALPDERATKGGDHCSAVAVGLEESMPVSVNDVRFYSSVNHVHGSIVRYSF